MRAAYILRAHMSLRPVEFQVLLALADDERHGYAIMQQAAWIRAAVELLGSGGAIRQPHHGGERTMMDKVRKDIWFGLRSWRRRPGLAAIALVTLALGIGVNTAMFSIVNGVLVRALPFRH